jgi:hypothetical protein
VFAAVGGHAEASMSESENTISAAIAVWLNGASPSAGPEGLTAAIVALVPAVPLAIGQKMLGDKARSEMYRAEADGLLEFVKDAGKTLVTTRSILAYQQSRFKPFASAKLKAPPGPKARRRRSRSRIRGQIAPEAA